MRKDLKEEQVRWVSGVLGNVPSSSKSRVEQEVSVDQRGPAKSRKCLLDLKKNKTLLTFYSFDIKKYF